jgi:hypothetical protein
MPIDAATIAQMEQELGLKLHTARMHRGEQGRGENTAEKAPS